MIEIRQTTSTASIEFEGRLSKELHFKAGYYPSGAGDFTSDPSFHVHFHGVGVPIVTSFMGSLRGEAAQDAVTVLRNGGDTEVRALIIGLLEDAIDYNRASLAVMEAIHHRL